MRPFSFFLCLGLTSKVCEGLICVCGGLDDGFVFETFHTGCWKVSIDGYCSFTSRVWGRDLILYSTGVKVPTSYRYSLTSLINWS